MSWRALAELRRSGQGWFLAAWLVSYTATNGLSVMFAVVMVRDFHTRATLPTMAYAIGVGCSLLLYRVVGGWDARFGPWRVLRWGLMMLALVVAMMVGLAALHTGATVLPILVCFGATQVISRSPATLWRSRFRRGTEPRTWACSTPRPQWERRSGAS